MVENYISKCDDLSNFMNFIKDKKKLLQVIYGFVMYIQVHACIKEDFRNKWLIKLLSKCEHLYWYLDERKAQASSTNDENHCDRSKPTCIKTGP